MCFLLKFALLGGCLSPLALPRPPGLCNCIQPSPVKNKNHLSSARVSPLKMYGGGSWGESWYAAFRKGIRVPRWTNGILRVGWRGVMAIPLPNPRQDPWEIMESFGKSLTSLLTYRLLNSGWCLRLWSQLFAGAETEAGSSVVSWGKLFTQLYNRTHKSDLWPHLHGWQQPHNQGTFKSLIHSEPNK